MSLASANGSQAMLGDRGGGGAASDAVTEAWYVARLGTLSSEKPSSAKQGCMLSTTGLLQKKQFGRPPPAAATVFTTFPKPRALRSKHATQASRLAKSWAGDRSPLEQFHTRPLAPEKRCGGSCQERICIIWRVECQVTWFSSLPECIWSYLCFSGFLVVLLSVFLYVYELLTTGLLCRIVCHDCLFGFLFHVSRFVHVGCSYIYHIALWSRQMCEDLHQEINEVKESAFSSL